MSKVRVYEVAKQLNISTKEIMDQLKEYGFEVHSHMSTLEDEEAQLIIGYYKELKNTDQKNVVEKKQPEEEKIKEVSPTEEKHASIPLDIP